MKKSKPKWVRATAKEIMDELEDLGFKPDPKIALWLYKKIQNVIWDNFNSALSKAITKQTKKFFENPEDHN